MLRLLERNGTFTIADLCKKTGFSESGVKKILRSLKEKGLLERQGSNKTGYWVVKG